MTANIYIVTPSFNAAMTIDRTIQSVVSQAGDFRIRYHVQDGGSTDGTLERLEWWKKHLAEQGLRRQCHGIRFSYTSEPDGGMYDALVRGFSVVAPTANSFMTWISADDILMPGALAFAGAVAQQFTPAEVSWFGGSACTLNEHMIAESFDRPIPREMIRRGLCDGKHWECLQQGGTFFRAWLWRAVEPAENIARLRLAGDWNLWRLMAARANFCQSSAPLAACQASRAQMLSEVNEPYRAEIDFILAEDLRKEEFRTACEAAPVTRRILQPRSDSRIRIVDVNADRHAQQRWQACFGKAPHWSKRSGTAQVEVAVGREIVYNKVDVDHLSSSSTMMQLTRRNGLIAYDQDWQFPAITEKHAFQQISRSDRLASNGVTYVAYPWATLIDKLQANAKDRDLYLEVFEDFCGLLPNVGPRATVCQHIHGKRFAHLFQQAGIDTVFWSHATKEDVDNPPTEQEGVRFLPFPLYPVQTPEALPEASAEADAISRKFLFSFIGARANQYYLTEARNWILDLLADEPRGLIIGRDSWHYQKVVYDLQIKKAAPEADAKSLVDDDASSQFRASLVNSTFSLCPAGSGPNSIRLWESIGAGSIPVILADTWAPPGDRRLWELAAVFCEETPEAIKALPDRLAQIAAEPGRLSQMRHAMRQLWLLYGPQNFVNDLQEFLLGHAKADETADATDLLGSALTRNDGAALLTACAGALLLEPEATQARIAADPQLAKALAEARANQPADSRVGLHYDNVLDHARRTVVVVTPAVQRQTAPKICLFGTHSKRTPLSYEPIRKLIGERLQTVEAPEEADLIVTGFNIDLRDNVEVLKPLVKAPKAGKIAVISEEPLWDITWSGPFTGKTAKISVKGFDIPYTFLGHETSDIYDFKRIPYFVLTSNTYAVRYANLMSRFSGLSPAALLQRWQKASIPAAFFAENRKGDNYSKNFPERDVAALSSYRTEVAEVTDTANVLRIGKGWGTEAPRQSLPDWHLDKLAQLDGRTRVLSAFENVHQRFYISEKIFDAFAIGAIPTYWASPNHRIFDLVPAASMLNCHGMAAKEAAQKIEKFVPDTAFAEAWLATAAHLAGLFGNMAAIQSERQRVADATLKAILSIL